HSDPVSLLSYDYHRDLRSFPTRRSSDLEGEDFELETLPRLVREKFPNVTLEVQKLPDEQYYTTVKTKLGAGEGPDIFLVFPKLRSEEHTSELQSRENLVCRLLLEKKKEQ